MSVTFTGPINLAQLREALGSHGGMVLTCTGDEWTDGGTKQVGCPSLTVADTQIAAALASTTFDRAAGLAQEQAALLSFLQLAESVASGQTAPTDVTLPQVVDALVALAAFLYKYWPT